MILVGFPDILMKYKHSGLYVCEKCGAEELNDFGKIKRYLDKHGPTNAIDLAANTGVRRSRIGEFLRLGKVEIPENTGCIYWGHTEKRTRKDTIFGSGIAFHLLQIDWHDCKGAAGK